MGGEGGNPPEHETILFFTRLLAGPMDFTPGIFDILIERGTGRPRRPEESRSARRSRSSWRSTQFIRDVAVDWDTTRVLQGRIGDYVVVARRERNGQSWFVGAITDEEARTFDIPLSFLAKGRPYVAEIHADGPGAN